MAKTRVSITITFHPHELDRIQKELDGALYEVCAGRENDTSDARILCDLLNKIEQAIKASNFDD